MATAHTSWTVLALVSALSGCELVESLTDDTVEVDPCLASGTVAQVAGRWTLAGTGSRSGCPSAWDALETDEFTLRVPPFDVTQATDGTLTAVLPVYANVSLEFSGTVRGTCVDVTLKETDTSGLLPVTRQWTFDGDSQGRLVTGDFSGAGPETCSASGSFSLSVAAGTN